MGSPQSELCRTKGETQHDVHLTHAFEISEAEVTQAEFEALIGYNPAKCETCKTVAVNKLSWASAVAYCNKLSEQKGLATCYTCTGTITDPDCVEKPTYGGAHIYDCPGYRLPTEAEWEYAYRAGTKTALYNGTITHCKDLSPDANAIAWYTWNGYSRAHEVKQKAPNPWGLYDMAGNVAEWIHDYFDDNAEISRPRVDPVAPLPNQEYKRFRRMRGGSFQSYPRDIRAAARDEEPGAHGWVNPSIGFRCARTLP